MQRYNSWASQALNGTAPAKACRVVLALLIACALALSFVHGALAVDDGAPLYVATLQTDAAVQPPLHHAPAHSDHCLQHLQTFEAPAELALTSPIVFRHLLAGDVAMNGIGILSPFRPPRLRAAS